ncbi:uncharacterized protein LY89DRAFT_785951 [Mollisia scopiformis]|uniref:Uncharacterized protein n=1 Tax=Mollisia scopiformis TaxID=149040 RepID=A0A194WXD6_MOLSC|nr:uncharacterized protein LY89DRAFT_785951 [Mollisia scopiformis]KUJ12641.1 hypothetical protein LY89DRAFT_785951 [Mollisia scopiformis]
MSFHRFNMTLSGSCATFASLVIVGLLSMHATHLSKPNEQIKIMKIGLLIPFYSILSLLSICFPKGAVDITPWLDLVQSVALGSFFLLMCEFVSENPSQRDLFFAALVVRDKKSPSGKGGGLAWYRSRWIMIFQQLVSTLNLVKDVSLAAAMVSVLKFYFGLRKHLTQHKPLAKLLAFKLVVITTFVLTIVFWILKDAKVLNGNSTLTYADLNIGLPNMIICVLMVPPCIFFHYVNSLGPYIISRNAIPADETGARRLQRYQGGFLGGRAWIRALNPWETIKAIMFALTMAADSYQERSANQNNVLPAAGYMVRGGRR